MCVENHDYSLGNLRLEHKSRWLVTGAAGFIGSHLVHALLDRDQEVIGLDDFSTGSRTNLKQVQRGISPDRWTRFHLIEDDIRNREACLKAAEDVDYVLHQAALGSVPRSIGDPLTTHDVNATGFLNMLDASRRSGVRRFVYAASSSTYGDEPNLPKREDRIGNPLSPYAGTKLFNEIYADIYARTYGVEAIGLRYFNVFGPRQDPKGAYAAVIPKWIDAMTSGRDVVINGDGSTTRDFCFIANAVQANLQAALAPADAANQVYNVAVGERTSLLELFEMLRSSLAELGIRYDKDPVFSDFRPGDVRHSQADIGKACARLGYMPSHRLGEGIRETVRWYLEQGSERAEQRLQSA